MCAFPLLADGCTFSILTPPYSFLKQNAVEIRKSREELSVVSIASWHLRWHLLLFVENGTLLDDASAKLFIF